MTQSAEPTIIVYTHPDCAYSSAAKMDYRRNKTTYTEIDLSKQPDKVEELLRLTDGERITPVIVCGDQITIGFKGGYCEFLYETVSLATFDLSIMLEITDCWFLSLRITHVSIMRISKKGRVI